MWEKRRRNSKTNNASLHVYQHDTNNSDHNSKHEQFNYEDEFNKLCPDFDIYPTILPHQERVIAVGDIHGDMNLGINFLKAARVIEEINSNFFDGKKINEKIYRLQITNNNISGIDVQGEAKTYRQTVTHQKNQFDIIYRYYKVDDEYYVKIVQEDNNPNYQDVSCPNNCDFTRWFKWIGGKTHVVQVGDQIDRCRPFDGHTCDKPENTINDEDSDLEIMLFYDSLDKIAKKNGGRVFSLLGNHEIMNVMGDMRYVSYKGITEYSPEPKSYDKGEPIRINKFKSIIAKKMTCTRSTIIVIGDYLFVHGGIANKLAYTYKLVDVNAIIRRFLHGTIEYNKDLKTLLNSSRHSPLWYRKLAFIPPDVLNNGNPHNDCKIIYDPIIEKINELNFPKSKISTDPTIQIKGMVIGHTPQFSVFNQGITTACSDRIIRTDIGGSSAFNQFANESHTLARIPQVMEIKTNLQTKESTMKVLYYTL